MKRFLAAFLCFGLLLTSIPLTAEAKEEAEEAVSTEQSAEAEEETVVTYEKPAGYTLPTGVTNDSEGKYTVTVNDEIVDLYPAQAGLEADTQKSAKSAFGYFDFSEPVTVKVTTDFDFESVVVRPLSLGIEPEIDGKTITFTLTAPSNISIEYDGNLKENLHLFSNYIESPDFGDADIHYVEPGSHSPKDILNTLTEGTANVVYFEPGVHILPSSEIFYIPSNTTIYIAGGAVVYGRLHAEDATNIRIIGRGIVNGSKLDRRADFGDGPESYLMRFVRCTNVEVDGIILQDSPHWTFVNIECEKVNVRNFRIVGQRRSNNDGMDIVNCRNFTVDHSFIRTIDDAITVKGKYIGGERNRVSNITIQNSTIWNEDSGNAQEIGFETLTEEFRDIIFRNNDIIHNNSGGTMTIHNGDSAVISGVVEDDIRVEGKTNNGSLVEMFINDTYYSTGIDHGSIDGVTFNRIRYLPADDRQSTFNGYNADSMIRNIKFYDTVVNGKQITGPYESGKAQFSYDQYVEAPEFSAEAAKFEPASGVVLYEDNSLKVTGADTKEKEHDLANDGSYTDIDLEDESGQAEVSFEAPASAHYIPILNVHKGPDGGVVKILIDGVDHGYWMDTYCEDEVWQAYTLTDLFLEEGSHTITFEAFSKHLDSSGYHFGLDYINLTSPDDITYEAENAAKAAADGNASSGYYAELPLEDNAASIIFSISDDRTSNLKLRLLAGPEKGKVNLLIDGKPQGGEVDLYSDTSGFKEFSFGTVTLAAGEHTFTLESEGQSDDSLELDYVKFGAFPQTILWRARRLYNNTYYNTSGVSSSVTGDTYDLDSTVTSQFAQEGDWANYIVTVPADGFYTVIATLDVGPDKGAYKITADDVEYDGTVVDAYAAEAASKEVNFGAVYLHYGENDLKFVSTGKNEASSGHVLTLNAMKLVPGVFSAAAEDTYTWDDTPDQNYGSDTALTIKQNTQYGKGARRAYMKFDLSMFGGEIPDTAEVRFTTKEFDEGFASDHRTLELYGIGSSWEENELTWNNQPDMDDAVHIASIEISETVDTEYSVNVADYLREYWDSLDGTASFMLVNETDGEDQKSRMSIYSSEAGDKGPSLWSASRPVEVSGFTLSPESVTMWPDTSRQLTASVLPGHADAQITYQSDNEDVASVNSRGLITAHKEGTAVITANVNDGAFTDSTEVTVVPYEVYEKALTPAQDSYGWDDTPTVNYGTSDELVVKAIAPDTGKGGRKALLDFDFSDYGGTHVERATLRLCLKSTDEVFGSAYRTLNLSVFSEEWDENTLTWNNLPDPGEQIATFQVGKTVNEWYEIDVTDYINEHASSLNGRISFMLTNTTDGGDQKNKLSFYSGNATEEFRPQLSIIGEGGEALPRLNVKADFAVNSIYSDGGVHTDDSLQGAVESGRAVIEMNGEDAGVLADASEEYDVGGELAMPKDKDGVITISLADDFGGSRSIESMDLLMRTGESDAKAYSLQLYYSTTSDPESYKLFYEADSTNALAFSVYPYIRLSGFEDQVKDVANFRIVSHPVDGDAPVFQEIDLNFTENDGTVADVIDEKHQTLRMSNLFADNMILQRDKTIRVWGWGGTDTVAVSLTKEGESETASEAEAAVADGQWLAELPALPGGTDEYTLTVVSGDQTLTYSGVLIGDVYLAGGQSNMAMFVKDTSTRDEDVADADYENIRFFTQGFSGACEEKEDIPTGEWEKAVGDTIDDFYAVAYQFAKEVYEKTEGEIPIGILSAATPGTWIECWMDEELLNSIILDNPGLTYLNDYKTKSKAELTRTEDYERRAVAPYNSMLHPLLNANIAGILWYQGENNSGMVDSYRAAFPRFINDLRGKFRDGTSIPFLTVQLPAYGAGPSGWSDFRLMQDEVMKETENGYLAVTIDCAEDPQNIHPTDKTVVGQRLAAIALNKIYGQDVVYSGPEFEGAELLGSKLVLSFGGASEGLTAKGDGETVYGFEISEDGINYVAADGVLVDGKVELSSPDIAFPQFVKYACQPYPSPMANLYNGAGLPAAPFTADISTDAVYVKLSANSAVLYPGVTKQFTAQVLPADRPQDITWTSSDEGVATVDSTGLVTAVSEGTATITAACPSGSYSEAVVTVKPWTKYDMTLSPTDDTYAYDYDHNGELHGSEDKLIVKPQFTNGSGERRSFLKFDFSDYGGKTFKKAVLRLCLYGADTPYPSDPSFGYTENRTTELYLTTGNWTEDDLTWTNQPAEGAHAATFEVPPTVDNWIEIDLTDFLNENMDSLNGGLNLIVKNITNGKDQKSRYEFYSKESGDGSKGPQLILEGEDIEYASVTEQISVTTEAGVAPILPSVVDAVLTNGAAALAPVTWDEIDESMYQEAGTFTVNGHVEGYDGTITAVVTVNEPVPEVDKTELQSAIQIAEEAKQSYPANLPADTKAVFENALADAYEIYNDAEGIYSQEDIDAAAAALAEATDTLYDANRGVVDTAIEDAEALIASGKYQNDDAMKAFKAALEALKLLKEEDKMTDAEVLPALETLSAAKENLKEVPKETLELGALEKAIKDANSIDLDDYLDGEAKENFTTALKSAESILERAQEEDGSVTQQMVDNAVTALDNAAKVLQPIPDKGRLQELVDKAKELDLSKYTQESAGILRRAVEQAEGVLSDNNADSQAVSDAVHALQEAFGQLIEIKPDPSDPSDPSEPTDPSNPADPSKPGGAGTDKVPPTGDAVGHTILVMFGCAFISLAAVLLMRLKRRKR